MLSISDQHLAAHEREQRKRSDALAVQWYRQQGDRLPQGGEAQMRQSLEQARLTAQEIGLLEDEHDRFRRLLAFDALIPAPTGEQWLLAMDAVFDLPTNAEALEALRALMEQGE